MDIWLLLRMVRRSPPCSSQLELGQEVRIVGCSREDLNGLVGRVRQHQSNGKIQVRVGNKAYALHTKFIQRVDPPSNNTSNASSEATGPCMTDLSSTLNTSKDRCAQYNWHKALDNLIENLEQWDVEISPAEFLEQMRTGKEQGLLTEETLEKLTKDCFKKGSRPKPDVANYALLDVLLEHFDPKVPELNFEEAGVTTSLPQWFDTPGTTEFMLPSAWIQRAAQDGSVKMLDFIEKKYKENGIDFECGYEQAPKYFHDPDYQLRRPIQQANLYFQYKTTGKWFEDRGFNDHYDDPETKMDHQYAILLSAMKRDREATKQKILAAQECNMDLSQLFDSYHMSEWYVEGRHVMIGDAQYFEDREITPLVRQLRANNSDSALKFQSIQYGVPRYA